MNWLLKIDGNKTYILAVVTGLLTLVHFFITSDYSISSFIQLSQEQTVIAMVAALRHGIAKAGNQGNVNIVTSQNTSTSGGK